LLLCVTHYYNNSKLVVCNPYSGQTRWIQPRNDDTSGPGIYGMGYDINNSHKILRLSYWLDHCGCEIYDFKSNSWRVVDITMEWRISGQGVSFQKNSYFISQGKRKVEEVGSKVNRFLLSFDFTSERFGPRLPLPFRSCPEDSVILSTARTKKLVVLFTKCDTNEMKIWITTKIEPNIVLWSNFLKVDMRLLTERFWFPYWIFFVDEKKKVAMI
ncbi:unnamed protein product, partial [Arabidopsis halleri]